MASTDSNAWIFVSHSSGDLAAVRKLRNYLEEKGAAPLLFHLVALTEPEEFWPIIEREIVARNFFLYCESSSAEQSEWVRRERDAVARAALTTPKRIGRVRVDGTDIAWAEVDAFLNATRVFLSYAQEDLDTVTRFIPALTGSGFQVWWDEVVQFRADVLAGLRGELAHAMQDGWVVAFVSKASVASALVRLEQELAHSLGARIVPVLLDPVEPPAGLQGAAPIEAYGDPENAPARLVAELLRR